jgi:hypothetical protein
MITYILTFCLQIVFNVLKVEEIKYSYENKTVKAVINSILINVTSLTTSYLSLKLMLEGDFKISLVYIIGSATGKWIATTKLFNYRNFIWNQMKNKS